MPTIAEVSLASLDLNDPALFADGPPHALFARMRAEAPVRWNRPTAVNDGFWSGPDRSPARPAATAAS